MVEQVEEQQQEEAEVQEEEEKEQQQAAAAAARRQRRVRGEADQAGEALWRGDATKEMTCRWIREG